MPDSALHPEPAPAMRPNGTELPPESAAAAFRALGDPTRLRILQHLEREASGGCGEGEGDCGVGEAVCACDLEAVTGLSQPTVSHHMKCLVSTGLVTRHKSGRWAYYRLNGRALARLRDALDRLCC